MISGHSNLMLPPKDKNTNKYKKFSFLVEKKLSVIDSKEMKPLSLREINVYIIRDNIHKYGFLYFSTKILMENQKISGESLNFISHPHDSQCDLKIYNDEFNDLQCQYKEIKENETKKSNLLFYPCQLYEKYSPNSDKKIKNPLKIHIKRICTDNNHWFLDKQKIKKWRFNNKKLIKEIIKDTQIDKQIQNILISMLFIQKDNKYIQQETHALILTQGGTGKSSILGLLGHNLDTTSNAGMFGYYNVKTSSWQSGEVSKTDSPLIVDEINEIMKKGDFVLETLNKPLDNGSYYYAKAGSRNIEFGNTFMFLGNIDNETHFETIISGLALNTQTIGRRFCYFIYNDKLDYIQGFDVRDKKINDYVKLSRETLSYILRYYLDRKELNRFKKNSQFLKMATETKEKILLLNRECEFENTRKFINEYTKSLFERVPFMAYKLAIFELAEEILAYKDIKKFPKSPIIQKIFSKTQELFEDIIANVTNIIEHQKTYSQGEVKQNLGSNIQCEKILSIQSKLLYSTIKIISQNEDEFTQNRLYNEDLSGSVDEKRDFNNFLKNLKRRNFNKNNTLSQFGLKAILDQQQNKIFFTIINKVTFTKYVNYFNDIQTTITIQDEKPKNVVEEIEIDDDLN